jgi:hypothetical protein
VQVRTVTTMALLVRFAVFHRVLSQVSNKTGFLP